MKAIPTVSMKQQVPTLLDNHISFTISNNATDTRRV